MAILGINLEEVENFIFEIEKVKNKINEDKHYQNSVLNHQQDYIHIYNFIKYFIKFLNYSDLISVEKLYLYRVRKIKNNIPFSNKDDLIYPAPNIKQKDRMNNSKFRVLYVALNENTAIAETKINEDYIGKNFQLTKFSTKENLRIFNLGRFSELYFNSPRDSDFVKNNMISMFGFESDNLLKGFAALECAFTNIMYSTDDNYHILSSIFADVIFNEIQNIDAIMYPSTQNIYGKNLAIKKEFADSLEISYTSLNELKNVYKNGFYKYYTKMECLNFDDLYNLKYDKVENNSIYR